MNGWENGWGLEFLVFMNNFGGRPLDLILEPLHWLGGEYGYTVLLPLVFWSVDAVLGRRLYLLIMGSALVNGGLKAWWARPRPYQAAPSRIIPAHTESSFGIPSGHSQGGMVLGLFLIRGSRRVWLKILYAALILAMGLSRMVMGVHFLQDVLVGWALGALVFMAFIRWEAPLGKRLISLPLGMLALLSLIPGLAAVAVDGVLPVAYPVTKNLLAVGGAYSGMLLGMTAERRYGAHSADGPIWKRILRFPVGICLLLGTDRLLSLMFHGQTDDWTASMGVAAVYTIRYLLVGLVGFWIVPMIFRWMKLSRLAPKS
ncbi:MAG: phosphatase PAP2 family protein [Spirochaetaceae bacterium]|nr:phosphatase PAP2 family protein [Spirochaetaceae bacterium]MDT8297611.1 phosphatase PAP2 family protein [Spirochaetaceae bacterium]